MEMITIQNANEERALDADDHLARPTPIRSDAFEVPMLRVQPDDLLARGNPCRRTP